MATAFVPHLSFSVHQNSTLSRKYVHVHRPCFQSARSARLLNRARAIRMASSDQNGEEETVSLSELKNRLSSANVSNSETKIAEVVAPEPVEEEEDLRSEKQKEIDRLRAAEKFIELDEGKYECTACNYVYEPEKGDQKNDISPGTEFESLPDSYTCPVCRTPKRRFVSRKKIIAGFAENQKYGLGSNALTGGEKSLLIFGGLGLCALLLLSGYVMN